MSTLWKVVLGLGTLVGLATGLGTIIGAIASSESFWATAGLTVKIAGAAYGIVVVVLGIALIFMPRPMWPFGLQPVPLGRKIAYTAFALAVLALFVIYVIVPWRAETTLFIVGAVFIPAVFVALIVSGMNSSARKRKTCLDCAETVRIDANVCHHCGFRFAPRPSMTSDPRRTR